jgi:hypothetical protein
VDAEAVYGVTTLTTLRFSGFVEVGEWVLDLSRLTLSSRRREYSDAVTDKEVLAALSHLTGLAHFAQSRLLRQRAERGCAQ